jgi:hypothetical protein
MTVNLSGESINNICSTTSATLWALIPSCMCGHVPSSYLANIFTSIYSTSKCYSVGTHSIMHRRSMTANLSGKCIHNNCSTTSPTLGPLIPSHMHSHGPLACLASTFQLYENSFQLASVVIDPQEAFYPNLDQ